MKHSLRLGAAIFASVALGVALAWADPQVHGAPAAGSAQMAPPDKNDVHVKQLYELVKAAHQPGATPDHAKLLGQVTAIADAHATETGADPKMMEAHVMQILQGLMPTVEAHPEVLATYDSFWTALHGAAGSPHGAHQ